MALLSKIIATSIGVVDTVGNTSLVSNNIGLAQGQGVFGGYSMNFYGASSVVATSKFKLTKDFTIAAWVKSTGRTAPYETFISNNTGNPYTLMTYDSYASGMMSWAYQYGGYPRLLPSKVAGCVLNTYKHLAFTRKDGKLYEFIDGALQGSVDFTDTIDLGTFNLGICALSPSNTGLVGYLDDVSIFDECLFTSDFSVPKGYLRGAIKTIKDKNDFLYGYK